jgi:hypothetical protein
MTTIQRCLQILIVLIVIMFISADSGAFVYDTHYYLTYGAALFTCFDWDEAHIIASADVMIDRNKTTRAEMSLTKKKNKRAWHAFGHSEERLNVLWQRVLDEENPELRLVKFGQFLHYLQDWESHAGYPLGIGHALATISGRDPDSLAKDVERTERMVQSTLDHMALLCQVLDRLPEGEKDSDLALFQDAEELEKDHAIADMIGFSDPKWRSRWNGAMTNRAHRIAFKNKTRTEEFVADHLDQIPDADVPESFIPGDEELGFPQPIEIEFTPDGALVGDLAEVVAEADDSDDRILELPEETVRLARAREVEGGWEIVLKLHNVGEERFREGTVRFIAADAFAEEQIGEAAMPIPLLEPGRRMKLKKFIPTSRPAEQVAIGVVAEVGEDGVDEIYEIWFMTGDDLSALERDYLSRGRLPDGQIVEPPVQTVELATPPKVKVLRNALCAVLHVRTDLNDPTEELTPLEVSLRLDDGESIALAGTHDRVWSISATEVGKRPVAKTFGCFRFREELCGLADWSLTPPRIEFIVRAGEVTRRSPLEMDAMQLERIRTACAAAAKP